MSYCSAMYASILKNRLLGKSKQEKLKILKTPQKQTVFEDGVSISDFFSIVYGVCLTFWDQGCLLSAVLFIILCEKNPSAVMRVEKAESNHISSYI